MTLVKFNSKSVTERYNMTKECGSFIVNPKTGLAFEGLYLIDGFFVKVFTRLSDNKVISVFGLSAEKLLGDYSQLIYLYNTSNAGGDCQRN